MLRVVVVSVAVVLTSAGLGACESSQSKSARLAKTGKAKALLSTISAGAANAAVKVLDSTVLSSAGGNAAVVRLQNTGSSSEAQVPVVIDVTDAKGASVYKNDINGLQPSLQQMAYLAKGQTAYWVNDQVLAPTPPKAVKVLVGAAKGPTPVAVPRIVLATARLQQDSSGAYATGEVRNASRIPQINLPIFAVALKGDRVVAAGRAIIPRLDPAPTKKPVFFKIFFIGNPQGARLQLTAAPTVLQEGKTS